MSTKVSIWQKLSFFPPIIVGVLVLAWSSYRNYVPLQKKDITKKVVVRTIVAQKSSISPVAVGYGYTRPVSVWVSVAEVSGKIVYIDPLLKKGEIVKKDSVVIKIDSSEYEIAVDRLNASIETIDAQIQELEISIENNEALLKIEKESLLWNEKEMERQKQLMQDNITATSTYEAQIRNALAQKNRVQSLQNTLNLIPAKKKLLVAQKKELEGQLKSAKLKLEYTQIKTPFSGIVSEVNIAKDQFVGAGQVLAKVDDISHVEIEAKFWKKLTYLISQDIKIEPRHLLYKNSNFFDEAGIKITVTWKGHNGEMSWPAEFVRFSGDIDPGTRSLGIVVRVKNLWNKTEKEPKLLLKGMHCEVKIEGKPQFQIAIPRYAVHENDIVYVVNKEGKLAKSKVEISYIQGHLAIVEGLQEKDKVILSSVTPAVDGLDVTSVIVDMEE